MKLKTMLAIAAASSMFYLLIACGNQKQTLDQEPLDIQKLTENQTEVHGTEIKPGEVQITTPLKGEWVASGKGIYEVKCQSCHRLTEEKLVGPGWMGVTKKSEHTGS